MSEELATDQVETETVYAVVEEPVNDEELPEQEESKASEQDSEDDEEDSEDPLDAEGDIAADYLEELLDIADLDGDIDTYTEGGRAHVSIVTDTETLVGKDGEVLDALQELARLAVMTETGHRSRLMLDIAGHRDRRRKELQVLAHDAIAEVKTSGEAQRLAPMNPFERKIVHDAVAEAGLVSESEGVEPKRRVVVLPAE
ncbi:Jag family protein [Luteococcus japonicus]|uniref:RNA-binding protein Jag n=1 Tax=Luteococcus japonicus LSP_Lj1 TaxID=1255658 RepID=A0A1R4J8D1_9ACTN|nr:R3H domain-containing nucleic acid-binding protein [Luteococcus japonicus]SJN28229.1 RNA-binding protein Jag [Luteococcus japonicus LSP_Lj1]